MIITEDEHAVVVVSGFAFEREMDQFVRSEIRYLKGFDMVAHRCPGNRLKFILDGFRGIDRYVRQLSAVNTGVVFLLMVRGRLDCRYLRFSEGKEIDDESCACGDPPHKPFAADLFRHDSAFPSDEILYHTF
jgi:hypothetical protein